MVQILKGNKTQPKVGAFNAPWVEDGCFVDFQAYATPISLLHLF